MSYKVMNAHYKRQCHPETCCCSTDFVIVKDGMIVESVDSEDEGNELIDELTESDFLRTCGD